MPRSSCEPCCNPGELSRHLPMYRDAHLQILCAIVDAIEASAGGCCPSQEIQVSYSETAFGAINNLGFTVVLPNANQLLLIKFYNQTNQPIVISFDNTNSALYLGPGHRDYLDFKSDSMDVRTDISAKYHTADGTSGLLIISAFYV